MGCCDDCKHKHVCKYREAADKFYEKINTVLGDILDKDNQDIFSVEIKCKNHSWDYPKEWDQPGVKGIHGKEWDDGLGIKGITLPNATPPILTTTNYNSCDGCINNPKNMPPNYVGDWPCQWCDKYPWKTKITCDSK